MSRSAAAALGSARAASRRGPPDRDSPARGSAAGAVV
jgi:hypothetical protein